MAIKLAQEGFPTKANFFAIASQASLFGFVKELSGK